MARKYEDFLEHLKGSYKGDYELWHEPNDASLDSDFEASVKIENEIVRIAYSWSMSGKPQTGNFIISGHAKRLTAIWIDSYHMKLDPMKCTGTFYAEREMIEFTGSYSGGPNQPDWGWRTEIQIHDRDTLKIGAYNIAPDGQEALAVKSISKRCHKLP